MQILRNHPLRQLNTFGIAATAEEFAIVRTIEELQELVLLRKHPLRILGGGSNVLLTGDLPGLTIKNEIGGIEIVRSFREIRVVEAGGGVVWHDLVTWCMKEGLPGIENLSLIPGTVGAAPIQNIGAYGVELQDVFLSLKAVDLESGEIVNFSKKDCEFGYRDSVFKRKFKGRFCIVNVELDLSYEHHDLKTDYGDIQKNLLEMGITKPTIRDVSKAVIKIRQSKLPDPAEIGNAGSFFKNPELELADFQRFAKQNPTAPHYPQPDGKVKVPAGWLIEQAGWKGYRKGDAGCHSKQALVLVNYGHASGQEILELAKLIQLNVLERFGIFLDPEVNVW